ncbi:MAG TPA: hypothetical protein GX724_04245 [Fibrobacter sp.]|nr:hypothetical protein [Fibrobacter sp.]
MFQKIISVFLFSLSAFASESLVSNFTFVVAPGPATGALWVLSRGDVGSGVTLVNLALGESVVNVLSMKPDYFDQEKTPVHDGIFSDVTAETRRIPFINAGKLGLVFPMFGLDSINDFRKPEGFFSVKASNIIETPLDEPIVQIEAEKSSLMAKSIGAFAYDANTSVLWMSRGVLGLERYDVSGSTTAPQISYFVLNQNSSNLDTLSRDYAIEEKNNPSVFGLALDPETSMLWLATENGLYRQTAARSFSKVTALGELRVTGVWVGGNPIQVIAETSTREKSSTKSSLWRSWNGSGFKEIIFKDTLGKVQKNAYDNADYSVSHVAFIGKKAFLAVQTIEGSISGLLKLDSSGAIPWDYSRQWLYDVNAGVLISNSILTSVTTFPLTESVEGLAVTSYGGGISVSADSGMTWSHILNQSPVKNDLGSIRMVPSVIVAGGESLVAYKVGQSSKITIEVFSYDMRRVRTIQSGVSREANSVRSSKATEDFWDGLDEHGRPCAMGIYYVRVKDDHGHVGWGKVMSLGGNRK